MKFKPFEMNVSSTDGIKIGDAIFSRQKPYFYRVLKVVDSNTLLAGKWRLRDRFLYWINQIILKYKKPC